ncbi:MAG: glycosyltransferase [Alphaproteobacteria bacterium]|nr:glycosyltransferase [Alphaproteobacteria bacterium]
MDTFKPAGAYATQAPSLPSDGGATARAQLAAAASADAGKLRVAMFSGNYNFVVDGALRAQNELIGHLNKRGHETLVFAPTTKTPAYDHQGELVSIPSVALPGSRSEYRLGLGLFGGAKRRVDAFKPTLIHLAAPDLTGFQALKYGEKRGIPVVASFHTRFDTYPRYYGAAWLEKYVTAYMRNVYGRCVHVYAPSESLCEELAQDGIGKDVRIWSRGVDSGLFSPAKRDPAWRRSLGFGDDDVVVAFVGRIVLEKGIDVFAEAVGKARAVAPSIKALVVGEGPERARFEANFPGAVFVGFQGGEALARAYASADVFFNPSITETFGNVTLEAMASGVATVAARAAGTMSIIREGVTGVLVDPAKSADGFAAALVEIAERRDWRTEMGRAARARSLDFNWEAVVDSLIVNYREAVASFDAAKAAGP